MTSTSHPNAQYYFERDVVCVQIFFAKRFGLHFEGVPILAKDIEKAVDLDKEIKASGFGDVPEEDLLAMETIHEHFLNAKDDEQEEEEENQEEKVDDDKEGKEEDEGQPEEKDEESGDEKKRVRFAEDNDGAEDS
jgi:RIO kinase 2